MNSISYPLATGTGNGPQPEQTTARMSVNCSQEFCFFLDKADCLAAFLSCGYVIRSPTKTFLKEAPPENRKPTRWWMFLAQLKLNIYRVPGLKNELCNWLSCENFDEKFSASSESLSRDAFQKMDVHLNLTMSKAELLSSLRKSDYLEEYGDILNALGHGSYALVDKELLCLSASGVLRKEVQTCIPKKALGAALQWTYDVVGHLRPDSWIGAFEKMFQKRSNSAPLGSAASHPEGMLCVGGFDWSWDRCRGE